MDLTFILIMLAVAAWLATMLMALLLPLEPRVLKLTRFLICPDSELIIEKFRLSYHRQGEFGIEVYYMDQDQRRHEAKWLALFIFWGMCLVVSLPAAWLLVKWFQSLSI